MKKLILTGLFLGACAFNVQAMEQAPAPEELHLGPIGQEHMSVLSPGVLPYAPSVQVYEFRESMTFTLWHRFAEQPWTNFNGLTQNNKHCFLMNLQNRWQALEQRPEDEKFNVLGYQFALCIHWHLDATRYLLRKIQANPQAQFSELEKVALCAVAINAAVFEDEFNHPHPAPELLV